MNLARILADLWLHRDARSQPRDVVLQHVSNAQVSALQHCVPSRRDGTM